MQALILAGGRGMRLAPLTNDVPPPLLSLPGGTVLDHLIDHLVELGISDAALVLQYGGDAIALHVNERLKRKFHLIPQYPPFTLMGALASAAPWVEGPVLVLFGNSYFSCYLHSFLEGADPNRPNVLASREEGAAGAFVLPPEAFYHAAGLVEHDSMAHLWQALGDAGMPPLPVPYGGWSRSIRSAIDLLHVNRFLLKNWHDARHPAGAGIGYDAINFNWIAPDADLDEESTFFFVTVAPGARVERSRVYNSLLLPGVHLQDAREQHAILAPALNGVLRLYAPARFE